MKLVLQDSAWIRDEAIARLASKDVPIPYNLNIAVRPDAFGWVEVVASIEIEETGMEKQIEEGKSAIADYLSAFRQKAETYSAWASLAHAVAGGDEARRPLWARLLGLVRGK